MEEIIVLQSVILQSRTGINNFDEGSIWIQYWFAWEKLPIAGPLYVVVVLLLQGNIWGCQMMPKVMPNHDRQVPVEDGCLHWKLLKITPWYPLTTNQAVYCMVLSTIFRPTPFVTKTSTKIGEPICIKSGIINWYLQVSQHTPDIFSSGKTVISTSSLMSNIHKLYSERPRGAGFRSVNPDERWHENPARALAQAGFLQHLKRGIHRSESSPEGSFTLIPHPVAKWAKTTP